MARIILIDDEPNVLAAQTRLLRRHWGNALHIEATTSPLYALQRALEVQFAVVLSDYRMPELDGITVLKSFRQIQPLAVRLIVSAYTDFDALVKAINEAQIYRFISKPWVDHELCQIIEKALAEFSSATETLRLADHQRLIEGQLSEAELEIKRLEAEEPGITKVSREPDGSIKIENI